MAALYFRCFSECDLLSKFTSTHIHIAILVLVLFVPLVFNYETSVVARRIVFATAAPVPTASRYTAATISWAHSEMHVE